MWVPIQTTGHHIFYQENNSLIDFFKKVFREPPPYLLPCFCLCLSNLLLSGYTTGCLISTHFPPSQANTRARKPERLAYIYKYGCLRGHFILLGCFVEIRYNGLFRRSNIK